jgi:hypothetical protein
MRPPFQLAMATKRGRPRLPLPCFGRRASRSSDARFGMTGLLAVDGQGARVTLDLKVAGGCCVYLILEQDTAIDLSLRLTGTVMGQRRAATA